MYGITNIPTTIVEPFGISSGFLFGSSGNVVEVNIVVVGFFIVITTSIVPWVSTTTSLTNIKLIGIVPLTHEYVPWVVTIGSTNKKWDKVIGFTKLVNSLSSLDAFAYKFTIVLTDFILVTTFVVAPIAIISKGDLNLCTIGDTLMWVNILVIGIGWVVQFVGIGLVHHMCSILVYPILVWTTFNQAQLWVKCKWNGG